MKRSEEETDNDRMLNKSILRHQNTHHVLANRSSSIKLNYLRTETAVPGKLSRAEEKEKVEINAWF